MLSVSEVSVSRRVYCAPRPRRLCCTGAELGQSESSSASIGSRPDDEKLLRTLTLNERLRPTRRQQVLCTINIPGVNRRTRRGRSDRLVADQLRVASGECLNFRPGLREGEARNLPPKRQIHEVAIMDTRLRLAPPPFFHGRPPDFVKRRQLKIVGNFHSHGIQIWLPFKVVRAVPLIESGRSKCDLIACSQGRSPTSCGIYARREDRQALTVYFWGMLMRCVTAGTRRSRCKLP